MNYTSLTQEPEKRRVILVVPKDELILLEHEPEGARLRLNNRVALLNAETEDSSPIVQKLRDSGLLNSGGILIQSPYDTSKYAEAADSNYTFAQDKCVLFGTLCGFLGARKISVKHIEIESSNTERTISGKLSSTYGGGNIEQKKYAKERITQEITLEREYGKAKPKLNNARNFITKYQWLSDVHINSLLDLCEAEVPIKSEKFKLSVTKESQKNLNIAFELNVPTIAELTTKIKQIKEETFDFSVEFQVEFWDEFEP